MGVHVCTRCGHRAEATLFRDFYQIPSDPHALLCEDCFAAHIQQPRKHQPGCLGNHLGDCAVSGYFN